MGTTHIKGPIDNRNIEVLTYIKEYHHETFRTYEKKLLYLMGLFYKVDEPSDFIEEVYNIFSQSIFHETGAFYTPMQSEAKRYIQEKMYYSFSAPTSSGKSYLFRKLINESLGDIVIVVPSRALISEYMGLVLELVDKSVLVLQFLENINTDSVHRRIYIVTPPERGIDLFSICDELNVELVLLDEAQISEEEVRGGMKFDSFVRRVDKHLPFAKKVFAHPFVNNPEAQLIKHGYNSYDTAHYSLYEQHTVGKMFITYSSNMFKFFSPYDNEWTNKETDVGYDIVENYLDMDRTVLIYISKAKIINGEYIERFAKYIDRCQKVVDEKALELINQLKEYIGANEREKFSLLIHMMEKGGIVVHHGSIPLKARLIIEEFVKNNYAKMCFATSTLNQGINMPFDIVWIDNFRDMDTLTLKNLIGRAGRSTMEKNKFDYGFVIVNRRNRDTFIGRINDVYEINDISKLDEEITNVDVDDIDLVEAMVEDKFNDELKLTDSQVDRLNDDEVSKDVTYIIDKFLVNDVPLNTKQYYDMENSDRDKLKEAFRNIYTRHLRKEELTKAEKTVLSAAIPILLWHIQGKSFSEVISLRYAFLSRADDRRAIRNQVVQEQITSEQAEAEMRLMKPKYSCRATSLPNSKFYASSLFSRDMSVLDIDYDTLVYDTYDYLDKVISLSLSNPLCAAFKLFENRTGDHRAGGIISNYIRYGTNDDTEIWLLRYGFSFDDIDWLLDCIDHIDKKRYYF